MWKTELLSTAAWYAALALFAFTGSMAWGLVWLLIAGCAQSFCLVPMSTVLLQHAEERYRGRVLGIRQFAVYGLPLGLLLAGPLIELLGFAAMAAIYCAAGGALTLFIALRWRRELWHAAAPVNRRQ